MCAFVGILRKDQLRQHMLWTTKRMNDARQQVVDRQFYFELNSGQNLWKSAEQLSRGLAFSIALFAIGILIFLCTLHWVVAFVVCLFACVAPDLVFPGRGLRWFLRRCYDACYLQVFLVWRKLWRIDKLAFWTAGTVPWLYKWAKAWLGPLGLDAKHRDPLKTDFGYLSRAILRSLSPGRMTAPMLLDTLHIA
jgi:hypothetical protein